jgi:nucleoside-diphosphate-sugar epimerase
MSTEFKNVAIIGASGNLGTPVLNTLLNHSPFDITVVSRQESDRTFPPNVKVIKADYSSQESLTNALKGQDVVLSLVGGAALGDQKKLIDAAIAAGVKRFLPSEYGSNVEDERTRKIVPVFEAKKGAVNYLKSKEDVIEWSSLVTGGFFDWGLKVGFFGFDFASKTATLIDEGQATFSTTNLEQIGHAIIAVLQKPAETKNQYVYVASFNLSQKEILAEIEKITGEKWTTKQVASADSIQTGREKLAKGDFSGIADLIKGVAFTELGDLRPAGLWNEKLGLKKESLEDTLKAILAGK